MSRDNYSNKKRGWRWLYKISSVGAEKKKLKQHRCSSLGEYGGQCRWDKRLMTDNRWTRWNNQNFTADV